MPTAKVTFAGYHSRAFALADDIPYCWNDGQDNFAHRYLTMDRATRKQLVQMGIHASLVMDTGQPAATCGPAAFYRSGKAGALIVMDPDGLEEPSAGQGVPAIFDLLWRSALGQDTVTLGGYATPAADYPGLLTEIGEVTKNFDMLDDQAEFLRLKKAANPPPIWVWPSPKASRFTHPKTLLIRTGFSADDWPALFGLIFWLKRLAIQSRTNDPATRLLQQHVRLLAWPITNPHNWRGCPTEITDPQTDLAADDLAGLIDIATGEGRVTTILVPDKARGEMVDQALAVGWQGPVELVITAAAFADEPLALHAGRTALICKILLPGATRPEHATSPAVTDLPARLLERLAYGMFGQIVPNRGWRPLQVDQPKGRPRGPSVLIDTTGTMTSLPRPRSAVTLLPGSMLIESETLAVAQANQPQRS